MEEISSNKRLAKNTVLLYLRTIIVMAISLFTSRIVLSTLGVDNYGIYNAVGGVVAMFTIISGSLTSAISRYITFELGHGDYSKLKIIFSTSVNIQIGLSIVCLLLGESLGVWFVNYVLNIPEERLFAANFVLQFSLFTFVVNLISIPYNAAIIAHERMSAFAYVSILEVFLKLGVAYFLYVSPWDELIVYALLLFVVSCLLRFIYGIYCNKHFEETKYILVYNKSLIKEMSGFAGWNFLTNGAYVFNTQGISILMNVFFSVSANAARGITHQVESALMQFVNNFTTALNPQITKLYASGNMKEMNVLVMRGARFSYFLSLIICLPIIMEIDFILSIWLEVVPDHTAIFTRLSIISVLIERIGSTGYTACMATGNIKRYVLWVTSVGCLVFPLTYLLYLMGFPVETAYYVYLIIYFLVNFVRLYIMKGLLDFPIMLFVKDVLFKVVLVTSASMVFPLLVIRLFPMSFSRCCLSVLICIVSVVICCFYSGITANERRHVVGRIRKSLNNMKGKI